MVFRKDINALRAVAVLLVVLYHFKIPGFSGGYVGVDVFFVISGFLMGAIIYAGLLNNNFSYSRFVLMRATRILPALLFVCLFLLVVGWYYLPALEYQSLSKEVFAAIFFVSNMLFWRESGYFDQESSEKFLLHTWSLSVEWQFYLLLPLVMMACYAAVRNQRQLIYLLLGFLLFSLLVSIFVSPKKPSASFYLLPTRAWEMLVGVLVYFSSLPKGVPLRVSKLLEILGYSLMLFSCFYYTSNIVWPGYLAFLPVLGAALVLLASQQEGFFNSSRIIYWFGSRSYSIYLWHWVVLILMYYSLVELTAFNVVAALLLICIISEYSYRYVEQGMMFYLRSVGGYQRVVSLVVPIAFISFFCAYVVLNSSALEGRINPRVDLIFNEANNRNPRFAECHPSNTDKASMCRYGEGKLGVIVAGDSHAASVIRSVERSIENDEYVLDFTLSRCLIAKGVNSTLGDNCSKFVDKLFDLSADTPKEVPLLVVNRLPLYLNGEKGEENEPPKDYIGINRPAQRGEEHFSLMKEAIVSSACELANSRKVYFVKPIPHMPSRVPETMSRAAALGIPKRVSVDLVEYQNNSRYALEVLQDMERKCGVILLDPIPYLCQKGVCYGDKNGLPLYFDDDHLNERGAQLLVDMFKNIE